MPRVLAIKNKRGLCWNCLKPSRMVRVITIPALGYGSLFDEFSTQVQLCEKCFEESNPEIWNKKVIQRKSPQGYVESEKYEYDEKMWTYIQQMPIQGRQFVLNEIGNLYERNMDPQDWIDYEMGILPHKKCEEYGLFSHDEISAYYHKFPRCEYPANRVFDDGSVGCWCPFGAYGSKDQQININLSVACYHCNKFQERSTPIKNIPDEEWDAFETYAKYDYYANKEEELRNLTKDITYSGLIIQEKRDVSPVLDLAWGVFEKYILPEFSKDKEQLDCLKLKDLSWGAMLRYISPQPIMEDRPAFNHGICNLEEIQKLVFFGAFKDSKLIGVIGVTKDYKQIKMFYVDSVYQHRGIGTKLFEILKERAKDQNISEITVNAVPYSYGFFHRLGFIDDLFEEKSEENVVYMPMTYTISCEKEQDSGTDEANNSDE